MQMIIAVLQEALFHSTKGVTSNDLITFAISYPINHLHDAIGEVLNL